MAESEEPKHMPWAQSHGTYLAGRAAIDEADHLAAEMETKWGCGRLRLLVSTELREKFDRQRLKFNEAIWRGSLDDVRREAPRMANGWRALDRAAEQAGQTFAGQGVVECVLAGGTVAVIAANGQAIQADGRKAVVYTAEEIARLLDAYPAIAKAKEHFPGATVERIRRTVSDPLESLPMGEHGLADEEIPF
jgi:hypothetical protein